MACKSSPYRNTIYVFSEAQREGFAMITDHVNIHTHTQRGKSERDLFKSMVAAWIKRHCPLSFNEKSFKSILNAVFMQYICSV